MTAKTGNNIFIAGIIFLLLTGFPRPGRSEDKSGGFLAGPLSAVVERVVEKVKPGVKDKRQPISETSEKDPEPEDEEGFIKEPVRKEMPPHLSK